MKEFTRNELKVKIALFTRILAEGDLDTISRCEYVVGLSEAKEALKRLDKGE